MNSYIEHYGITEQEFDELVSLSKLHPEIHEAIQHGSDAIVDGDFYEATAHALSNLGYRLTEAISFKDKGIKGTRYRKGAAVVEVSLADFLGVFTDVRFKHN
jgi:hypothetical protein